MSETSNARLSGNDSSWIVVMSAARARIFSRAKRHSPLQPVQELDNPEGRLHGRDLTSDLGGRTFDSHGPGRHSIDADYDPRDSEVTEFVREVAAEIERARLKNVYKNLIVIAPAKILGQLRGSLSGAALRCVVLEMPKQLVEGSPDSIASAIESEFR